MWNTTERQRESERETDRQTVSSGSQYKLKLWRARHKIKSFSVRIDRLIHFCHSFMRTNEIPVEIWAVKCLDRKWQMDLGRQFQARGPVTKSTISELHKDVTDLLHEQTTHQKENISYLVDIQLLQYFSQFNSRIHVTSMLYWSLHSSIRIPITIKLACLSCSHANAKKVYLVCPLPMDELLSEMPCSESINELCSSLITLSKHPAAVLH